MEQQIDVTLYESIEPPKETCMDRLWKHKWFVLFLWQFLAITITLLGAACTWLQQRNGSNLPYFQLFLGYSLLLIINGWKELKSKAPWTRYLIGGFFNLVSDILVVYAYSTTSLASAILITSTVVFWVAPLSYFLYKTKYSVWQILSMVLGLGGVSLIFVVDGTSDSRWLGDLFALLSSFGYSISCTLQEGVVHEYGFRVYQGRFCKIVWTLSGILSASLEYKEIRNYNWDLTTVLIILGYIACLAGCYTLAPIVMSHSNATEQNLSYLTSNFYSLGISILAFNMKASWLYLAGFLFIPISIAVFSLFPYKEKDTVQSESKDLISQTDDILLPNSAVK